MLLPIDGGRNSPRFAPLIIIESLTMMDGSDARIEDAQATRVVYDRQTGYMRGMDNGCEQADDGCDEGTGWIP